MIPLKNKTILITGASSGIGAACAKHFAQRQSRLLLCARSLDALNILASELNEKYNIDVYVFKLDIRDAIQVSTMFNALPDDWKKIDILINNAGLAAGLDHFQDAIVEDWEDMINTNVKGLLYVTKAVIPQMLTQERGHIINLGSVAGHEVYPKGSVYCATKFAVHALTQGLRMDLNGTNIRVSTVDPGAVETNFSRVRFKGDEERASAVYKGMTPLTPDDVAETIVFCATRPLHVNISEVIILPTDQASASIMARKETQ